MVNLAKQGMTMIVVTHEMGFAKEVADQMIFMDEGMIVEKASKQKTFLPTLKVKELNLFLSQILIGSNLLSIINTTLIFVKNVVITS